MEENKVEDPIKAVMIPLLEKDKFVRKCPGPRYKVVSGPGGHYVYDYKSLDVVKKDGKFFMGKEKQETNEFLLTLDENAPVIVPRKFQ